MPTVQRIFKNLFILSMAMASLAAHAQLGVDLGTVLGATANTISSINAQNQARQYNQQLLQELNSQEAQTIQANIMTAQLELSNLVARDLMPCLQRSSIGSSSVSTGKLDSNSTVLGQSCKQPRVDLSVFEQDVTCSNSKNAQDTAEAEKKYEECRFKQAVLLQKVVGCFDGFQSKMSQATQKLQGFLSQRNTYMKKVLDTYNNNINGHERSANMITAELDGPEGYKDQVMGPNGLDAMLSTLDDALNAPAMNSDRIPGSTIDFAGAKLEAGLKERWRHFQSDEQVEMANQMYGGIVGGARQCFANGATICDTSSGSLPSTQCLAKLACIGIEQGSGYESRCAANQAALQKISADIQTMDQFNTRPLAGNLNPFDPNAILNASNIEQQRMSALIMNAFDTYANAGIQQGLSGKDNLANLRAKISDQLSRCFALHQRLFTDQYNTNTASSPVHQRLEALRQKQLTLEGDMQRWIRTVAEKMTRFRTKFTSTFDSTLKQFSENCYGSSSGAQITAIENADTYSQNMLMCLQTLRERLAGGINGTNGEAPTIIQIPVINGTPGAVGSSAQVIQQQCVGFKDCIQKLEVARKLHMEQKDTLTSQRQASAKQHNGIVEGVLDQVASSFNAAMKSQAGLNGMLARINNLLGMNEITARLVPKAMDPEALELDEKSSDDAKSQIYKMPKDMLAAIASRGGLQMLKAEDIQDVKQKIQEKLFGGGDSGDGIQKKLQKADKILAKAHDKLRSCTPGPAQYSAILDALGNCKDIKRFCNQGIGAALNQMESIATIVSTDPSDNKNSGLDRRSRSLSSVSRCINEARQDSRLDSSTITALAISGKNGGNIGLPDQPSAIDTRFACYSEAVGNLRISFGEAREEYRSRHGEILANLENLIGVCDKYQSDLSDQKAGLNRTFASTGPQGSASSQASQCLKKVAGLSQKVDGQWRSLIAPRSSYWDSHQQPDNVKQAFDKLIENYLNEKLNNVHDLIANTNPTVLSSILKDLLANPNDRLWDDFKEMTINSSKDDAKTRQDQNAGFDNAPMHNPNANQQLAILTALPNNGGKTLFIDYLTNLRNKITSDPGRLNAIYNGITKEIDDAVTARSSCVDTTAQEQAAYARGLTDMYKGLDEKYGSEAQAECNEVMKQADDLASRARSDQRSVNESTSLFDERRGN